MLAGSEGVGEQPALQPRLQGFVPATQFLMFILLNFQSIALAVSTTLLSFFSSASSVSRGALLPSPDPLREFKSRPSFPV
jgi:hypothetical protein